VRIEESVRIVWVWTDYDPFVKDLGRFLVSFAIGSLRPWGWIIVIRWQISCPAKTVEEREEEMRRKERGGNERKFFTCPAQAVGAGSEEMGLEVAGCFKAFASELD